METNYLKFIMLNKRKKEKEKQRKIEEEKKICAINKHYVCQIPGGSPHPTKINEYIPIYRCNLCNKYGIYESFYSNT